MARQSFAKRKARPAMLIVCEGENTEPEYFRALKAALILHATVDVEVKGRDDTGHTDPLGLINEAKGFVKRRKNEAEQNPTKSEFESVHVVFDAERRTEAQLREVILAARKAKMKTIISRPSFEVWYLLHDRRNLPAMSTATDAERHLVKLIEGYGKNHAAAKEAAHWALENERLPKALTHSTAVRSEIFTDPAHVELPCAPGTDMASLVAELIQSCSDLPAKQRLGLADSR